MPTELNAAIMETIEIFCKMQFGRRKKYVFTHKLSKTVFASHYLFIAVVAALRLFQQGTKHVFFFQISVCLPVLGPGRIFQSCAVSYFKEQKRTHRLSWVPNMCQQLAAFLQALSLHK